LITLNNNQLMHSQYEFVIIEIGHINAWFKHEETRLDVHQNKRVG